MVIHLYGGISNSQFTHAGWVQIFEGLKCHNEEFSFLPPKKEEWGRDFMFRVREIESALDGGWESQARVPAPSQPAWNPGQVR